MTTDYARTIETGRETNAEEWAMRQGLAIAHEHLPKGEFQKVSALASDIAEALTSVRRLCNQGLM